MIKAFKKYLEEKDFTKNTISNYLFTLKQYKKLFGLYLLINIIIN